MHSLSQGGHERLAVMVFRSVAGIGHMRSGDLFRRAALWIGAGSIIFCVAIGMWFYDQSGRLIEETQNSQSVMLAAGLANAVEPALVAGNIGAIEQELRQTLANLAVESALVASNAGVVLSHVRRDSATSAVVSVFQPPNVDLPADDGSIIRSPAGMTIWKAVPRQHPAGWIRLDLPVTGGTELLESMRWKMILLVSVGAAAMSVVLALTLMNVHAQVAQQQSRLEYAASHDTLTGLPNRLLLMERLKAEMARCRTGESSLALCFLDVDDFKTINDRYGHDAGDEVLIEIARRLRGALRQSDTISRFAGDEFVLLATHIASARDYGEVLNRIMGAMKQPLMMGETPIVVSLSIGITVFPQDSSDAEALIAHADQALYGVKRTGKGNWKLYDAAGGQVPEINAKHKNSQDVDSQDHAQNVSKDDRKAG